MKYPMIQSLAVLCLSAAGMIAAAPAVAATPASKGERGRRIDTHRLDLTQRDTVAWLYGRIQSSARMVCRDSISSSESSPLEKFQLCYDAAVGNAVHSVHAPLLTALHDESTHSRVVAQAKK